MSGLPVAATSGGSVFCRPFFFYCHKLNCRRSTQGVTSWIKRIALEKRWGPQKLGLYLRPEWCMTSCGVQERFTAFSRWEYVTLCHCVTISCLHFSWHLRYKRHQDSTASGWRRGQWHRWSQLSQAKHASARATSGLNGSLLHVLTTCTRKYPTKILKCKTLRAKCVVSANTGLHALVPKPDVTKLCQAVDTSPTSFVQVAKGHAPKRHLDFVKENHSRCSCRCPLKYLSRHFAKLAIWHFSGWMKHMKTLHNFTSKVLLTRPLKHNTRGVVLNVLTDIWRKGLPNR